MPAPDQTLPGFNYATNLLPLDLSERQKVHSWEETLAAVCPLEIDQSSRTGHSFWGSMDGRFIGGIFSADVAMSSGTVRRTDGGIARRPTDTVYVFHQINPKGSSFTTWKGKRGGFLDAGDLFIGMTDEAFESACDSDFGHRFWLLPSRLVLPFSNSPSDLEAGIWLRSNDPCNRMIASYLGEFAQQGPRMTPQVADVFAGNIGRLLAVASVPQNDLLRQSEAVRMKRMGRIKQEIELRLADPLISPSRVAEALNLSLRTLHASFAATDETCAAYITRRRLEEANRLVTQATWRPISDIALALGFNSMGTFYRTYRQRFGETPTETRQREI